MPLLFTDSTYRTKHKYTVPLGREYYAATMKDYDHPDEGVILHMRTERDCLDPEIWHYLGRLRTTKAHLRRHRAATLKWINETTGKTFTHLHID